MRYSIIVARGADALVMSKDAQGDIIMHGYFEDQRAIAWWSTTYSRLGRSENEMPIAWLYLGAEPPHFDPSFDPHRNRKMILALVVLIILLIVIPLFYIFLQIFG
jgi:hypothetical protein